MFVIHKSTINDRAASEQNAIQLHGNLQSTQVTASVVQNVHVISGLPKRNGNKHASEIANMSLDLLASCKDIKIPYISWGKIKLRMGIHSGK